MKHVFYAGKYWIGDPCYAVKDENWSRLIDETGCFGLEVDNNTPNWDNGFYMYNGRICFAGGTKYGDGYYLDNLGHGYGVDAGLIGIMPVEACDDFSGGHIVEFESSFIPECEDGFFKFDNIEIETDWEDPEELEEESGDDWE